MLSLIIPVYRNEGSLGRLLERVAALEKSCGGEMEAIFVVDASPDRCFEILSEKLPVMAFRSRLILLSRNFGAFAAIAAGMQHAAGDLLAVMAADLQEPAELIVDFWRKLHGGEADIVFGYRTGRADPAISRALANLYWAAYRRLVNLEMPQGGVDVFGCTRAVSQQILALKESPNHLISLLFWVGFRRAFIPYERHERKEGKGAWTMAKKLEYAFASIFNFTDLPIRLLLYAGAGGMVFAVVCSVVVLLARFLGHIPVAGYTPIVLAILFFGALTCLGLGIVGQYQWLTLQRSRERPGFLVSSVTDSPMRNGTSPDRPSV